MTMTEKNTMKQTFSFVDAGEKIRRALPQALPPRIRQRRELIINQARCHLLTSPSGFAPF